MTGEPADAGGGRAPAGGTELLRVEGLRVSFPASAGEGEVRAVDGVDLRLGAGETLGLVGESGCGKSVTALSLVELVPGRGRVEPGSSVRFRGEELVGAPRERLRRIRGGGIGYVFQEPTTSLNPVLTIGEQVAEPLREHRGLGGKAARREAIDLLARVGIPDPGRRHRAYPHQLSGGQRQRVMIAMAVGPEPAVIVADEPTTALDVTVQARILELLASLREELGTAMLLITHDLGVVAEAADRVAVMYAGQVVEEAPVGRLLRDPRHPYTRGLLDAVPDPEKPARRLAAIPGSVPDPREWPAGCRFHPRCPHAWERCRGSAPPLLESLAEDADAGAWSRCWLEEEEGRAG